MGKLICQLRNQAKKGGAEVVVVKDLALIKSTSKQLDKQLDDWIKTKTEGLYSN